MAQLPRLQTPTDKELLLVLQWTAHAQDPSGAQPPPRTQQEIEEWIANDEFEDLSDASSMGSAGDIVEVDPDFDAERFLYRSGSTAGLHQNEPTAGGHAPTGGEGPVDGDGQAKEEQPVVGANSIVAEAGIAKGEGN